VKLNKIDVACSMLDTSIELWFYEKDPISIHTLVCSSYQIIHDINKQVGWRDLLYDSLVIKDEYQKEMNKRLKESYNFFKHADKDKDDTIEFNPELSNTFIMFSCFGLKCLSIPTNNVREAFVSYYALMKPEILKIDAKDKMIKIIDKDKINSILEMKRSDYLEIFKAYNEKICFA
jgi:hypothetical protein